jgi:sugar/nucleoside kinase (ribokinase family)
LHLVCASFRAERGLAIFLANGALKDLIQERGRPCGLISYGEQAMTDVVCIGILVADVWAKPVNEWPERGRLSLVDRIGISIGGCAANTGIHLAKLGGSVAVMGKVGRDVFGEFVTKTLESYGIVARVARSDEAGTSATMVMIDDEGERSFIHYVGANATLRPEDLDMELIKQARVVAFLGALVMPGFDGEPAASVMAEARAAGATTALDTVWDDTGRWMEVLEPCVRQADLFLPSLAEAQELTGEREPRRVAKKLLDYGVKVVVLKMGEEGCYVLSREGEEYMVPVYEVNAVDGTGSGDAYVAGFLRGYVEGWPLERCAKFGNAAGALCVTGIGATAGTRSFEDTMAWLREREPDYW